MWGAEDPDTAVYYNPPKFVWKFCNTAEATPETTDVALHAHDELLPALDLLPFPQEVQSGKRQRRGFGPPGKPRFELLPEQLGRRSGVNERRVPIERG
ncbi:hypothetical protein VTO42DRAFT_1564 [Malbranchea cinnamomea]